jgi:hypothetical protein
MTPRISIKGVSTYRLCGAFGFAAGLATAAIVGRDAGLAPIGWMAIAAVPALSLFATLAMARLGVWRGPIVFHEKAAIAVAATAAALLALGEPVASGIDLVTLGIGAFLAIGRLGCLNAGCCHGRRARRGVRYRWVHAAAGFPERWVGMTLFPVQLVDGAISAVAVLVGIIAMRDGSPGTAAASYACVYGAGRFVIERFRGDGRRNQRAGLTEAQWAMIAVVAIAAVARPSWWSIAVASALALAALVVAVARSRRRWPTLWLTCGWHLAEIDAALGGLVADREAAGTSGGLRLSLASCSGGAFELALELAGQPLPASSTRAVAGQLGRDWTVLKVESSTIRLAAGVPPAALSG